jgi:hypothetical protein
MIFSFFEIKFCKNWVINNLILKPEKLEVPGDSRVLAQVPGCTKTDLDLLEIHERWDSDPQVEFLMSILTSILRLIHGLPRVVFTLILGSQSVNFIQPQIRLIYTTSTKVIFIIAPILNFKSMHTELSELQQFDFLLQLDCKVAPCQVTCKTVIFHG